VNKNYIERFEEWMIREGRINRDGYPYEGLSPTTAKSRKKSVRRILIDLGFIKRVEGNGSSGYIYDYQRGTGNGDIRKLTIAQLVDWFKMEFPTLKNIKDRQRKSSYVEAVYKFVEFLHFELRQWSRQKVEAIKKKIRRPWVPPPWENKVEILPIHKIDSFISYLKTCSRTHHMMVYLMRYSGMRYAEVVNAKADMRTGTLLDNLKEDMLIIYGKGRGGLSQKRSTPFLEENHAELKDYLRWRDIEGVNSKWLFVNQYGKKFSDHSGHFNTYLRRKAKEFGFTKEEVKLVTSHKVGRHAYGTSMTIKGLPERFLCDNMGIRNPKILTRYQNATEEVRVNKTKEVMNSSCTPPVFGPVNNGYDYQRKRELIDLLLKGSIDEEAFKLGAALLN